MTRILLITLNLALLSGCMLRPLKPGVSRIASGTGTNGITSFTSDMKQPENPAQAAAQTYERTVQSDIPVDAGTKIVDGGKEVTLLKPTVIHTVVTEKAGTQIGAAQKDVAREMAAKLGSLRGIVWVGVILFIFGIASAVYPPLKVVTGGSMTTSAAIAAGGLALIILPTLLVGHELLILGAVAAVVGIWFVAHRHGSLQGIVNSLTGKVTAPAPTPAVPPSATPAQTAVPTVTAPAAATPVTGG